MTKGPLCSLSIHYRSSDACFHFCFQTADSSPSRWICPAQLHFPLVLHHLTCSPWFQYLPLLRCAFFPPRDSSDYWFLPHVKLDRLTAVHFLSCHDLCLPSRLFLLLSRACQDLVIRSPLPRSSRRRRVELIDEVPHREDHRSESLAMVQQQTVSLANVAQVDGRAFPHCQTLTLDTCQNLHHLSVMSSLQSLSIRNGRGSMRLDEGPLVHLTKLHLASVADLENHQLEDFMSQAQVLVCVTLSHCPNLTDLGMLASVENLVIRDCRGITTGVSTLGSLARVELHGCAKFPSSALRNLTRVSQLTLARCPQLRWEDLKLLHLVKTLDLSYCDQVTDVEAFARCHSLTLRSCQGISDVSSLARVFELNLAGCQGIVDITALSQVVELDVSNCQSIRSSFLYPEAFVGQSFRWDNCIQLAKFMHETRASLTRDTSRYCEEKHDSVSVADVRKSFLRKIKDLPEEDLFLDEMRRQIEEELLLPLSDFDTNRFS